MKSNNISNRFILLIVVLLLISIKSQAIVDVPATSKALRIANTITGGKLPITDPVFAQMVLRVQAGDVAGAALLATNTSHYVNYLAKRLAYQMQNPALDSSIVTDSAGTAFLIAHFSGAAGVPPSISTIWSENATYLVRQAITASGDVSPTQASNLTPAKAAVVNWQTDLVRVAGQNAKTAAGVVIQIPVKHVGGYVTLSDKGGDTSFAMYGATAGTNLRMIEGLWEIATGLTLVDVQSSFASPQNVPKFIPQNDPNFFKGDGQSACISCHGGGFSSLNHGYNTVADLFEYDVVRGLVFITTPATATRKSLGSDAGKRAATLACNLQATPTIQCNPNSFGTDVNQTWDLSQTWTSSGVLVRMGWIGPLKGEGLNSLGQEIGKSSIVYKYLTKRVVQEICPMGTLSEADVSRIANMANPFAAVKGTDDIRTIISQVAAHASCQ